MRWILIGVALFGAVDAAVLWSERPSRTERAWQRYWQAQAVAAPAPWPPPTSLEEPLLPPAPTPPRVGAPALEGWLRENFGEAWPSSLFTDLAGAVEIDLSGLSPAARTGALLLGRFLPAEAGVTILQDGERLRITLSAESEDV